MSSKSRWAPIPGVSVIGAGHKARHGKDTAATYLIEHYGARRYSFADDLKAFARVLGMEVKNGPLLQALGTDVFRALDPDKWVKCLYARLQEERPKLAVIPDVRFYNEVALVKQMGGTLVKVMRFNEDGTPFISADRPADHPSEIELDGCEDWDVTITCKPGEFARMYRMLDQLMVDLQLLKRV